MGVASEPVGTGFITGRAGLQSLLDVLHDRGYDVWGPVVSDGTITAAPLDGVDQLPTGVTLDQAPGRVELRPTGESTAFAWASPPQAWKPILHPPQATMAIGRRVADDHGSTTYVEMVPVDEPSRFRPLALVGLRPCDVAAVDRLDTVLLERAAVSDVAYEDRRRHMLVVAVDCAQPAPTCFCASTGDGPHVDGDGTRRDGSDGNSARGGGRVDIEITEFDADPEPNDEDDHDDPGPPVRYLMRAHSPVGGAILSAIPTEHRQVADADDHALRLRQRDASVAAQTRRLPDVDVRRTVGDRPDHPAWQDVAERCLACGNCTAVCPTCFCTDMVDLADLTGDAVERQRRWDTCFSLEFSRVGSSIVRSSVAARYRQWLVHKVDTWHDQFGESGCVGCGRCIVACPVGIDVVAEVRELTASGRGTS